MGYSVSCFHLGNFFFRTVCRLTHRKNALFLCSVLFWGTLFFPYSSQLWGHTTAAAFGIIAFYFLLEGGKKFCFYAGFFGGLSVLTEYSCAILVISFGLFLLGKKDFRSCIFLVFGGIVPLLLFGYYHQLCFGAFFTTATFFNNPYFITEGNVGGLFGKLRLEALWGITFSSYRGLFWYMPILVLALPALAYKRRCNPVFLISIINILGFLLMNISFNGWHGGACIGPRYQIPVLPFYVILLTALPNIRSVLVVQRILFFTSSLSMLLATAITPLIPQNIANPLFGYYRGLFHTIRGKQHIFQLHTLPIRLQTASSPDVQAYSAFNFGTLIGLPDIGSLLLYLVLCLVLYCLLWCTLFRTIPPKG